MKHRQGNKGSKRGSMHPYLRIELWQNGTLSFWRGSSVHNQSMYEEQLSKEIALERNSSVFSPNPNNT
jgi:hypothetical protein